jgi:adenylate cyclase class 2
MPPSRKPAPGPVETEAKIRVPSFGPIRRKIEALGGRVASLRTFEQNTLFDAAGGPLRAAGKSFRVRRYGDSGSVTLKGVARVRGGLKSREELETAVDSPEALARILAEIGFAPQFRYDKFREVWELDKCVICLDETPLGRFVELEGTARIIHRAASLLALDSKRFLSDSYPALWFKAGRRGDMVFARAARPKSARRKAGGRPD